MRSTPDGKREGTDEVAGADEHTPSTGSGELDGALHRAHRRTLRARICIVPAAKVVSHEHAAAILQHTGGETLETDRLRRRVTLTRRGAVTRRPARVARARCGAAAARDEQQRRVHVDRSCDSHGSPLM